jgi:hypothetical protein
MDLAIRSFCWCARSQAAAAAECGHIPLRNGDRNLLIVRDLFCALRVTTLHATLVAGERPLSRPAAGFVFLQIEARPNARKPMASRLATQRSLRQQPWIIGFANWECCEIFRYRVGGYDLHRPCSRTGTPPMQSAPPLTQGTL